MDRIIRFWGMERNSYMNADDITAFRLYFMNKKSWILIAFLFCGYWLMPVKHYLISHVSYVH